MSDITMLGLGAMGSALAGAFLNAGHSLTVWNRTRLRTEALAIRGASAPADLADAIKASPVIVVCIDNYSSTRQLLNQSNITPHLSGRTVVQLSTGSPREARESESWVTATGAEYLVGAILPYPDGIGAEDAQILFAGPQVVFERCKPLLDCLGGDLRYVGQNIAAAATLNMALLTHELCVYLGALHGAQICRSEDVGVDILSSMFPEKDWARHLTRIIHAGAYDNPGASIEVWSEALRAIEEQARDSGINSEIPEFVSGLLKRAIAAGLGGEDIAALIKVLTAKRHHA
jgi:3-hydroxyisobutyrate dehydrogenase-like beta-hydroxyacid dehydrogenase